MIDERHPKDASKSGHREAVRRIAEEVHRPEDEVARIYEATMTELSGAARLHAFLPVLVSRRVRRVLRAGS